MTERDIDIIKRLKARARQMGVLLLIGGSGTTAVVVASGLTRGTLVMMLGGLGVIGAIVGLYKIVRVPIYLRSPGDIDRIDRQADVDAASIQVVMTDGMTCLVNPVVATRDGVVQAIEAYRAEAKLRTSKVSS